MRNKKILWIAALLIAMSAVSSAGYPAYTAGATNLEIFAANITPSPVEPGQDLLVSIILKNSGSNDAPNTTAVLKASYPLAIKTVQNEIREKNICAGCASNIIYALSVDPSAHSGSYPVELEVSYGTGATQVIGRKTVDINVVGTPRITFSADVSEKVTPKSAFSVDFEFANIGTGSARDIKISTPSREFVISGGAPVIDSIPAGQSKKITVNFVSSPDVSPNVYSIPIFLNYVDEFGDLKESSSSLGISVLGNSDLIVKSVKIEPSPVLSGNEFAITVRVQNVGYGEAKEVVMELEAPYSGYKKAFIGKLGKDEDAPAIFNLVADSKSSDAALTVKYRDDFGEHEKTESIRINIAESSRELFYAIIGILVVLAAAYRKRIMKLFA